MKKTLSEFIAEINQSRKSGLLSIAVKGKNTLLKLFFREGEIYHLTCGDVKGAGCLNRVTGAEFAEYFYMPDVSLDVTDGDLPSLMDIIRLFGNQNSGIAEAPLDPGKPSNTKKGNLFAAQEQLTQALIKQIGPAGTQVAKRIIEHKWKPSSPVGWQDFQQLTNLLKDEIESEKNRNNFLKEAEDILS